MKCPKCSYTSFDYLDNCRKCGADLRDVRSLIQIISVPPEEKAPSYEKGAEPPFPAAPVPADPSSLFANDFVSGDTLGEEEGTDQDLLAGLDFDQSFDQMVGPASPVDSRGKNQAEQDGLLDLDFEDVFGNADAKKEV